MGTVKIFANNEDAKTYRDIFVERKKVWKTVENINLLKQVVKEPYKLL